MDIDPEALSLLRRRAKVALRQRARALRNSIPAASIAARSARIVTTLAAHPLVIQAASIALFWPMEGRNEVDVTALDLLLRDAGKRIAYPAVDPESRTMTFRYTNDPTALQDRGLGFREPGPEAAEVTAIDVVVVPALQIDPRGHRIGYGAGFYDRTLPRFCPPGRSIGVAFDFQLAVEVPIDDGDVAVSLVVTDERTLPTG